MIQPIRTNIVRNARLDPRTVEGAGSRDEAAAAFERTARTTPDAAARQILDAVERNRRRVLVGPDARLFDLVSRLPAGPTQRALAAGFRRRR